MRTWRKLLVVGIVVSLFLTMGMTRAQAKTYKLTVVAGHPPIFLWVSLTRDFLIPEIDARLAGAGGKDDIKWNQAYGGTVAKIGGVLEAIEEGVADLGFVGTLFEAPKMPLHNVSYMTPFGSSRYIRRGGYRDRIAGTDSGLWKRMGQAQPGLSGRCGAGYLRYSDQFPGQFGGRPGRAQNRRSGTRGQLDQGYRRGGGGR